MVTFAARRSKPEMVAPARPTPHEYKALSDIDDQHGLRLYETGINFFRCCRDTKNGWWPHDSAKAVKAALAEALVYYYPIAGRLRELPGGKLVVDCTGEGVVFVEADADVRIEELGEPLVPPYPCVDQLLCEVHSTENVVGSPLLFVQVTRFKCGGFTIGSHQCHNIADGFGMLLLLKAVADLARGEEVPNVLPVWQRELLMARAPPLVTHAHPEYEPLPDGTGEDDVMLTTPPECMVDRSFFFGPKEIAAMRNHVPPHLQSSTVFELVTAAVWRCRTAALEYTSGHQVRVLFSSNARGSWKRNPPLPRGFYGNALLLKAVMSTAGDLCGNPLGHALELVRKAKFTPTDEYMQSVADMMALRGRPHFTLARTYVVSDLTRVGHEAIDFGWGERIGGGPAMVGHISVRLSSYYTRCKNGNGEEGIVVPLSLPRPAMERFIVQMAALINQQVNKSTKSSL